MDLTVFENDEPRIQDLRLAAMLEYDRQRDIRQLIERPKNRKELERYGRLRHCTANPGPEGGRPGTEYWLNEGQALLLAMKAGTPRAADCREDLIKLFQAWRQGRLAPRSEITLADISAVVRREIEPVHHAIAEIRGNVAFLSRRVDDIVPRREFPKEVKQQFRYVAGQRYHGECPCCRKERVVDDSGDRMHGAHYDHYNGRERNRAEDGWIVCAKCNWRLQNDAEFKERARSHFRVFQDYLKQLCLPAKTRLKKAAGAVRGLFD